MDSGERQSLMRTAAIGPVPRLREMNTRPKVAELGARFTFDNERLPLVNA